MNNNKSSIDGFIPRRPGNQLGELHKLKNPDAAVAPVDRTLHTGKASSADTVGTPRVNRSIGRDDISESLREIDAPEEDKKSSKRRHKRDKRDKKPKSKTRRIIFWVIIALVAIVLGIVGYVTFKGIFASNNIFQGSILDIVQNQPLKKDANGRSNFVVFGTAEDDEGGEHGGANLTDSIMVVSIDQDKKNAYMLSLPRDLWVEYQEQCWSVTRVS